MQAQAMAESGGAVMATGSISVLLPCYNEEANVESTVRKAIAVLNRLAADFEVIIVNDGSADHTGQIADRLAIEDPRIKAIHHPKNRGYGGAVQSGIRASTREFILHTDGDGQFDMNELPALLPLMEQYDFVACWRIDRKDPWIRRLNAWCWTRLVNLVFGMRIRDVNCAFKLFRRRILEMTPLYSTGALISAEILARATRSGCRITQRGVHHYPRTAGVPTGAQLRVILRAAKELVGLRRQILEGDKNAAGNA
jgi:glycosyltransferase involved in cell wall biosynthesis